MSHQPLSSCLTLILTFQALLLVFPTEWSFSNFFLLRSHNMALTFCSHTAVCNLLWGTHCFLCLSSSVGCLKQWELFCPLFLHSKNLKGFLLLSLLTHERILKVENISLSTYQEDKLFNYSSFSWTWTQHTDQTPRSKVQEATQGLPVEKRSVGYVTIIARQHWKDKHARSSSWVTDPVTNGVTALVQCRPHALAWPYLILTLQGFLQI